MITWILDVALGIAILLNCIMAFRFSKLCKKSIREQEEIQDAYAKFIEKQTNVEEKLTEYNQKQTLEDSLKRIDRTRILEEQIRSDEFEEKILEYFDEVSDEINELRQTSNVYLMTCRGFLDGQYDTCFFPALNEKSSKTEIIVIPIADYSRELINLVFQKEGITDHHRLSKVISVNSNDPDNPFLEIIPNPDLQEGAGN